MTSAAVGSSLEDLYAPLRPDDHATAASVLLKLRGDTCNIDCLYCFEKRKDAAGGATISADTVEQLATLFGGKPIAVELHGGEPLTTSRDDMASILDRLAAMPNVATVTLQTNGILLDDAWIDLFEQHYPALAITISLDGDPAGNTWRVDYRGRSTHSQVEAAIGLLARRGHTVGITTVVTSAVITRAAEVMAYLHGFGNVAAINLIGCFDSAAVHPTRAASTRVPLSRRIQQQALVPGTPPAWSSTPEEYTDFVLRATGYWIASGMWQHVTLSPTVAVIRRLRGLDVRNCHFSNRKCDHLFTVYPDGRVGSCDELPWPAALLTDLTATPSLPEVVQRQAELPLLRSARDLMHKCVTCSYQQTCGGGCISHRLAAVNADGTDDRYCHSRQHLIDGIAALLASPDQVDVAQCRRIRWNPRDPNTMHDIAAFLHRWDDPATPRPPATLLRSVTGNINTIGAAGVHAADDLDPRHPQWRAGIEDHVWPIVHAIVSRGYITYDSCQGHPLDPRRSADDGIRVGVLPRDPAEAARLTGLLCHAASHVEQRLPSTTRITVSRGQLRCETSGRTVPVLDVYLVPADPADPSGFYADRPTTAAALAAAIADNTPTGLACACLGDLAVPHLVTSRRPL